MSAVLPGPVPDRCRPHRHRHDVLTIRLTLSLSITLNLSWRQLSGVLTLMAALLAIRPPAFSTARQWLLRLALATLRQAACVVAGGWTLLIDHTLGRGTRECFVVLGIATTQLQQRTDHRLTLSDMTTLAIEVMDGSNGDKVAAVLKELLPRLGTVNQIVTDGGSDLLAGVGALGQSHCATVVTCDVRHLCAALLRAWLKRCPRWGQFIRHCGSTAHQIRQTAAAFLAPPALRDKARYMNLDSHVGWASRLLCWQAEQDWQQLTKALGKDSQQTREWFEQRFGWLEEFEPDVANWSAMLRAAALAQQQVHNHGLSRATAERFWLDWRQSQTERGRFMAQRFAQQIRVALRREGSKLPKGQVVLGSSDVIESLFGKYKEVMGRTPENEVTANVLLMALMTGEQASNAQIKTGLETVDGEQLRQWTQKQFGPSNRSRTRELFGVRTPQTQVIDQKPA